MIRSTFFCCCLAGLSPVLAQAPLQAPTAAPVNPWKAAVPELPLTVQRAKVLSQVVGKGGGGPESAGGDLVLQMIAPPVLPPAPVAVAPLRVGPPLSVEEMAARRAVQPTQLLLFSPLIQLCPGGVSHVSWSTADPQLGWRRYSVFVWLDLSSASACGDLTVGRTRYAFMPSVMVAGLRSLRELNPPAPAKFAHPRDIILMSGDLANELAMAPLHALLAAYDRESELITSTFAAQQADYAARLQWEAAHPQPKQDMVVKFWPLPTQ